MLPNEIQISPKQSLIFSWALVWRAMVIALPASFIGNIHPILRDPLFAFVTTPLVFWLAAHWLMREGRIGSQRIVFMEQAHYQDLVKTFNPTSTDISNKTVTH